MTDKPITAPISVSSIFLTFLTLGCLSFGGPAAHLGYFREEFVAKKRWISDEIYAEWVALCQLLPGPASSQVGFLMGWHQGGLRGAFAAWLGFTLPSALIMLGFALSLSWIPTLSEFGLFHGLKLVAVVVVAHAVWSMGEKFCHSRSTSTVMAASCAGVFLLPSAVSHIVIILVSSVIGMMACHPSQTQSATTNTRPVTFWSANLCLMVFWGLLIGLPFFALQNELTQLFSNIYQAGALVFGGGHVVLPLLQHSLVDGNIVKEDIFYAGYSAAQTLPGPLFTFAVFLGASTALIIHPVVGAVIGLIAIFMPGFLLLMGVLPYWGKLKQNQRILGALAGVNAAVVGILLAALFSPLWISTVHNGVDFAIVITLLVAAMRWHIPPWGIVLSGAGLGMLTTWVN
ncbi:chromate efflux transporter [Marinibactrum halimedae]|uniref:Transporter n=1 Tax=Marinibactrum halimedae TaxID=1444977 RepID=A0AA37T812_9GAMM|nr:chromate efflux transporter [Marinibactrum halimedae]MCD9460795.1 chromate efflux transporter [Marinibactrum halimedae]GLS27384.1 transporter [Marinibactrum halimedae]